MQAEMLHMTNEIRRNMELEKLEKRRDEIIGFNKDIEKQLNQIIAANKKLNEDYIKLIDQAKINNGALSENQRQIDEIKNSEIAPKEEEVVDTKSKKKK